MKVEEVRIGDYEGPTSIFFKLKENRMYRLWKRGVIMKLMEKRLVIKL